MQRDMFADNVDLYSDAALYKRLEAAQLRQARLTTIVLNGGLNRTALEAVAGEVAAIREELRKRKEVARG